MGQVALGLVFHNHQPIGNFGWVNEEHYQHAYLPLVECLERHPGARVGLHYTGSLLDWLWDVHPDLIDRIRALVTRGQVEVVGGGYFEPVLTVLPEADRVGQIRALADAVRERFGTTPTGMWLAERVWEPGLPHSLLDGGMQYSIVDDTHLYASGLSADDRYGYYLTEDDGRPFALFASLYELRYTMLWRPLEETMAFLREIADHAAPGALPLAFMGDDGEKFGGWPGTYGPCWTEGYMDRFFAAVEASADWLTPMLPAEYRAAHPPLGRVYLPTASYVEMSEWVLPADAGSGFAHLRHEMEESRPEIARWMRGGFWRSFMMKYPEINRLHKRMLRAHAKVHAARALPAFAGTANGGDGGLMDLYRGQNNDVYWHGVFGGIYMNHMRAETTHRLILAENAADAALHAHEPDWLTYTLTDADTDGTPELLVTGEHQSLLIDPGEGGTMQAWDVRRPALNAFDTLARRPEAYHATVREAAATGHVVINSEPEGGEPKAEMESGPEGDGATGDPNIARFREAGLEDYLSYDAYDRVGGIEHLLDPDTGADDFRFGRYTERGDFVRGVWTLDPIDPATAAFPPDALDGKAEAWKFTLRRAGQITWADGGASSLTIEKTYTVQTLGVAFTCHYRVTNGGPWPVTITFASEWNINLQGGGHNDQCYTWLPDRTALTPYHDLPEAFAAAGELHLGNVYLDTDLYLILSPAADLWKLPIETVSNSEGGFERVYQGTSLIARWPLDLASGATWEGSVYWTAGVAQSSPEVAP